MGKCFLIAVISVFFVKDLRAQKLIFGQVLDGATREPLPYVNVYINNSTLGTVTNERGEYSLQIPKGRCELVFSLVGYNSNKLPFSVVDTDTSKLDIKLDPSKTQLETVHIRGTTDKEWEKLIKQFNRIFLGSTRSASNCIIKNAWCVDLESLRIEGKKVLTARASQPLQIENLSLGYKINYELQKFAATEENERFSGNVFFVELQPTDAGQAQTWGKNRDDSYKGSLRHLFNSMLTKQVRKEGFVLSKCSLSSDNKVQDIASYDPASIRIDSLKDGLRIWLPNAIQISYENHSVSGSNLVGNIFQNKGYIDIDNRGMLLDPLALVITGYLGEFRVANLLPDDYQPDVSETKD